LGALTIEIRDRQARAENSADLSGTNTGDENKARKIGYRSYRHNATKSQAQEASRKTLRGTDKDENLSWGLRAEREGKI
jgi:hypothetical protein